jgi:hypothetical protein
MDALAMAESADSYYSLFSDWESLSSTQQLELVDRVIARFDPEGKAVSGWLLFAIPGLDGGSLDRAMAVRTLFLRGAERVAEDVIVVRQGLAFVSVFGIEKAHLIADPWILECLNN